MTEGLLQAIVTRLLRSISTFLKDHPLGETGTGLGFVLAHAPSLIRTPDVYYIARERLITRDLTDHFNGAPDLAVEVLSPNESVGERQGRICEYLTANTQLVWVVDPANRTVMACYPSGYNHVFSEHDVIGGGDVLPGFSCRLDTLFSGDY
jgi:Uma2 family endonuclease